MNTKVSCNPRNMRNFNQKVKKLKCSLQCRDTTLSKLYYNIFKKIRKNSCSNSGKKKPLTNVVFGTDFEQVYFSPRSISLESLNYRQYSTNQKLAQIQNKRRLSNVICADFNYAPAWWSTATF